MGILDRWRFVRDTAAVGVASQDFVVTQADVVPELFGLPSWSEIPTGPAPRVTRAQAIQVPPVKRARDLIAGTIGALPLYVLDRANGRASRTLFDQPEVDVPRSVTMGRLVEDLLFEEVAWWRVVARDFTDRPSRIVRLDPCKVRCEAGKVYVGGVYVPDRELIRFYSPTEGLLSAGARAIRTCLLLEAAAQHYAEEPAPQSYFRPVQGANPLSPEQASDMLDDWGALRRSRSTGYVPPSLELVQVQAWSPKDMQLADARQHAALEVARLTGVDPEDLGVSTTSRTYANAVDRRMAFQDFTLGPFVSAIQDRLSMDDVTPMGHRVRFDFGGFTRSSEADRLATYQQAKALGLYGLDEMARREELPKPAEPAPAPAPTPQEPPVSTQQSAEAFAGEAGTTFTFDVDPETFKADAGKRTVTGLLLPFGAVGRNASGRWRFAAGSVEWPKAAVSRVKLNAEHDRRALLGAATVVRGSDAGIVTEFKVRRGPEGDAALMAAEDGVLDGLSAEVDVLDYTADPENEGVYLVTRARLTGAALTGSPAFDDARLTSVAASSEGTFTMPCTACGTVHAAGTPCATPTPAPTPAPADFSAAVTDAIREGFAGLRSEAPPVIPAGAQPLTQVTEELPYRFDGGRAAHCFSRDLIDGLGSLRDGAALQRVEAFMAEVFNVTTGNVSTLNPNRQRPDLYVDQAEFEYPMYSATNKGTLSDNTPFVLPKFSTSSNLVGDHTEGAEPAGAGALTTTSQTITPTALSGKTVINREVWDQGGSPQLDTIMWRQIVRAYYEGLESYVSAQLTALAGSITDIPLGTAVVDAALEAAITSQLATLQYVRGGNRFRDFFVQVDLFKALAAAKDTNGRKLFPIIAPQNATGTSEPFYQAINVGGLIARPAWALAPTGIVVASSWLFDREVVGTWASAPQKLTMDAIKVATVEIGVWGYKAFAVTDLNFVREVTYDPV